jgi:phospholipid/cholesterol/gamma-HCH transport system ATP-binding protein
MEDERRTADEHAEEPLSEEDLRRDEDERRATAQTERVSVVNEPQRSDDDEFRWHTGLNRPTGAADAVEFVDVHKAFGRNKILRGLNMGIPEGKISMILGPSGTGKSVCIKHMVGLLYPDEGDILVHGESVPNMHDDELFEMRKKFGVLFQDGALFGSMNLLDNVAFPLRQHTDKGEEEILDIVNRRLTEVGLQDSGDKMPNELSGGMRKRAGFARALVLDLRGDHPRHHECAPSGRAHLGAVEGPDRGVWPGRGALQLRQRLRAPVPVGRVAGAAGHGIALTHA